MPVMLNLLKYKKMRTIKFRGKSLLNGKWIYGYLFIATCGDNLMIQVNAVDAFGVEDNTVGQFTGILDKNGKEIYEGDIVEYHLGKTALVVFDQDNCSFVAEHLPNRYAFEWIGCHMEVIGNIHDNPELLKGR